MRDLGDDRDWIMPARREFRARLLRELVIALVMIGIFIGLVVAPLVSAVR